jgi:hypothetical protein
MSRYLSLDDSIKLSLHVYIHQYMMLINAVPRNVKTIIGKYVVTSVKSPQLVSWYGVRFEAVISASMSIRGHFPASISFRRIRYWYQGVALRSSASAPEIASGPRAGFIQYPCDPLQQYITASATVHHCRQDDLRLYLLRNSTI